MKYPEKIATPGAGVQHACNKFLDQANVVLPLDAITVVLLDPGGDTGRVVFSWRGASNAAFPLDSARTVAAPGEREPQPVISITMYGMEGPIGSVLLHTSTPGGFSALERRMARDISEQLAIRLENSMLQQTVQTTSREIALLDQVARIIASYPCLDQWFDHLASALGQAARSDRAVLNWLDANRHDIHRLGSSNNSLPAQMSRLVTPIIFSQEVIGSLSLYRTDGPFSTPEKGLVGLVCHQVAPALQNARLHQSAGGQSHRWRHQRSTIGTARQSTSKLRRGEPDANVDVAHALYSPLTSIKGYTNSLLQSDVDWPAELQREFLRTIARAADQLDEAIRNVLSSAPTERSEVQCRRTMHALPSLLASIEGELSNRTTDVWVHFRCEKDLPEVLVDQRLIKQAVSYLVDSLTEIPGPGKTLSVEARSANGQPLISVEVSDNMLGRWSYGPASSMIDDWDLRVVACRNIMEAHGTTLQVDPTAAGGPRFQFTLPSVATSS